MLFLLSGVDLVDVLTVDVGIVEHDPREPHSPIDSSGPFSVTPGSRPVKMKSATGVCGYSQS